MNLEPRLKNSLANLRNYTEGVRNQSRNLSNLNERFGEEIFNKISSIKVAVLTF